VSGPARSTARTKQGPGPVPHATPLVQEAPSRLAAPTSRIGTPAPRLTALLGMLVIATREKDTHAHAEGDEYNRVARVSRDRGSSRSTRPDPAGGGW
jgi:hypothetical protein